VVVPQGHLHRFPTKHFAELLRLKVSGPSARRFVAQIMEFEVDQEPRRQRLAG